MDFAQPLWLIGGFLVCLGLFFFFRIQAKRRQAALEKFVAHQLLGRLTANISTTRRHLKKLLLLAAIFLSFVALARPQVGEQWIEVKRKGIDLLFALDTSKSMLAEDIKPNRLRRANLAILDFVQKEEGDRLGLMPFAGTAYLMCPLTIDYDAFLQALSAVNTDLIPQGGTNIAAVIDKAVQTLDNAANHKILIILTDGENLQGDAIQAAESAAKRGLTIFTVGVGTSQGELIPIKGVSGQGFVKDQAGNFVTSRLDAASLSQIAEKSGGLYVPLGPSGEGLATIYQQKLALIPKEELAERRHKVKIERFEWPLALAAILLIIELFIGERKVNLSLPLLPFVKSLFSKFKLFIPQGHKFRLSRQAAQHSLKSSKFFAFLFLLLATMHNSGYASQGEDAYRRGDYLQSSEYYRKKLEGKPNDPQLLYNFGTAAYKNNMYDEAADAFTGALKSDKVELQQKAYYNRGNSYYQKGAEMRQADPKAAAGYWRQALNSFNSSLELDKADADAALNRNIVAKRLEELEKQMEKDQDKKERQQGEKDEQQGKKDGDKKDQGQDQEQKDNSDPTTIGDRPPEQQTDKTNDDQGEKQGGDKTSEEAKTAGDTEVHQDQAEETQQAASDTERQQLGKMTKEEAERLLNALKNEEGNLNFVPSGRRAKEKDIDRDW